MKRIYFIIFLLAFLTSCEKKSNDGSIANIIIGKWEWVKSCGGFTGGCWYPSVNNTKQVEFTSSHRYITSFNGTKTIDEPYSFGESHVDGNMKYYTLVLSDGWSTTFWFTSKDSLEMVGGDFVKSYNRIK
jgi:hypothetical protein